MFLAHEDKQKANIFSGFTVGGDHYLPHKKQMADMVLKHLVLKLSTFLHPSFPPLWKAGAAVLVSVADSLSFPSSVWETAVSTGWTVSPQ